MKKRQKRTGKFGINEISVLIMLICTAICVIFAFVSDNEKISIILGTVTVIITIIGVVLSLISLSKSNKKIVLSMFAIIAIGVGGVAIKVSIPNENLIQDSTEIDETLRMENEKDGSDAKSYNEQENKEKERLKNGVKENNEKMKQEQFKWEEDIFLTDKSQNIIETLHNWKDKQLSEHKELVSQRELNDGEYGKLISDAQKYYNDYQKSEMNDVKLYALEQGIESRKKANSIFETCGNIKEIGTWLLQKARFITDVDGTITDNTELIEQAIKFYIKALSMAYASGNEKYYIALWNDIAYAYELWSMSGERDEALRKKAKKISDACTKMIEKTE